MNYEISKEFITLLSEYPKQINNDISNNGNINSSNSLSPSSTLSNQTHHKGHSRKRSLSAPTAPLPSSEIQDIPIQRNPKHSSQSSQPPMSSEEYQRKLNEELEKVDFNDITVSELKDLLRQRNKPATGKKAILMKRLQEEIKLVKAMKNNKGGAGIDGKDANNNTDFNNAGDINVINNGIRNNVNVTNNHTSIGNNDNNGFDQQQQQPYQPMTTSPTITNNGMLNYYDVMTSNNTMTSDCFSSLLQQLNIHDPNNAISHQGLFFQDHPMSAPATKTEFFVSLGDNNVITADNDDDIVIKDEEMSNVNNPGSVTAIIDYDVYHQQPSSAPPMMTEFNNNYEFINHQIHNKSSLSIMDDGNDDSQMMMSDDPTSSASTTSLLNDQLVANGIHLSFLYQLAWLGDIVEVGN
ncbi:3184_t:CDS:2 [Entrophospora sp. SA101]|nr:3184_t:CDS:2 [Entrophospora sp. SA101]